ncbi:hypothetical protein F3J44_22255 [Pantoea sp. Tr-811]|uniref:hypothetical protein n=1 Tax=Pantoea sp. Tr-811 TaxID=2608361 RepID=UPI00141EDAFF|nr:hypothetical protein [Pantoea sp. Tr-811]NIF29094.1 hypothetical protein [Pantoea sp. Tr-811]
MNVEDFQVHDIRTFPLCLIEPEAVVPGYSQQWARELDALMARGEAFVLIYREPGDDEPHEDRKLRTQWLKQHKVAFAGLCRGIISVLEDAARRAHFDEMGQMGEQVFGIRYRTAATVAEGEALGWRLLQAE